MIAQLLAITLLGSTSAGMRPGTVEVTANVKDGSVISGEYQFKVSAKASSPITQVEFYVGDDLRDTDSSTPYEFKIDTLAEPEGDLKVTFAAYTTEGDSGKCVVTVKIDNELSKGADYHVQKGLGLVSNSKFDEAIQAARIALKAKPDYNPARLVMARAYLGKGVLDSAQKYAEDVLQSDPQNTDARNLVSGISLKRAFSIVNTGGEKLDTLKLIGDALKTAVESRQKTLIEQLDKIKPTEENMLKYCDQCIEAGRYSAAINLLVPLVKKNDRNAGYADRLLYAYLRDGNIKSAYEFAESYIKRGQPDGYGYALIAVCRVLANKNEESDQAMKLAVDNDLNNPAVKTAEAYIALRRGKTATFAGLVQYLVNSDSQSPAISLYLACTNQYLGKFDEAQRAYEKGILAEPACFDILIQRAMDSIAVIFKKRLDAKEASFQYLSAQMMYEAALKAKPDSVEALTGLAIAYGLQGKHSEFLSYARAASKASPNYPAGLYTLAAALAEEETVVRTKAAKAAGDDSRKLQDQADAIGEEAHKTLERAGKLDPVYLENIAQIPKVADAYLYFVRFGKLPLLAPTAE